MLWFLIGILIVLVTALYTVSTRGGGRWMFLPWASHSRNDLAQEEYLAEVELNRRAEKQKAKDLAP